MVVTSANPRDALLGSFVGVNAAGRWTLFVADVSDGGEYRLESWTLTSHAGAGTQRDAGRTRWAGQRCRAGPGGAEHQRVDRFSSLVTHACKNILKRR
jgi:hypothetical protein